MSIIDLNNPPPNHRYTVSVDREETDAERYVRLAKDVGLFIAALLFVGGIYWLAYETVTSAAASAEEKKWASSILSAIASGLVGYLVHR